MPVLDHSGPNSAEHVGPEDRQRTPLSNRIGAAPRLAIMAAEFETRREALIETGSGVDEAGREAEPMDKRPKHLPADGIELLEVIENTTEEGGIFNGSFLNFSSKQDGGSHRFTTSNTSIEGGVHP